MASSDSPAQYVPKPEFMNILKMGGANCQKFTMKEILRYLANYIKLKKIYDPNDYHNVICGSDDIGKVFGVERFSDKTALKHISRNVTRVTSLKRPGDKIDNEPLEKISAVAIHDSNNKELAKETFPSSMFLRLPFYPPYQSESDSPLSLQGYETALVEDSSDEWISSSDTDASFEMQTYEVEFEVNSSDSGSAPDSDSDVEDVIIHTAIFSTDSDMEFWADRSDDEESTDTDPELQQQDKWICRCGVTNKPLQRYCSKCWNLRNGWLSRKKLTKKKSQKQLNSSVHSAYNSSQGSANSPVEPEDMETSSDISDLCQICVSRKKTATLVHGRTGHQVCCYPCGRKLEEMRKPCPVCRRTISKVIKNFLL